MNNDGRREMASRKAVGTVSGFFKLWKIFGCLKGKGKELLTEESQDDGQEREAVVFRR